jgi:hypothetical protein
VRDQVSHPYKTTGKITVLCILICNATLYNNKIQQSWCWPGTGAALRQ